MLIVLTEYPEWGEVFYFQIFGHLYESIIE